MKFKITILCLITALWASMGIAGEHQNFIFVFNENTDVTAKTEQISENLRIPINQTFNHVIRGFTMSVPVRVAATIVAHNPEIEYYEEDKEVWIEGKKNNKGKGGGSNPPPPSDEPDQVISYGTIRIGGPFDGTGLTAWVVDTGIDYNHPDLNVDTGSSKNFVPSFFKGKKRTATDGHGHGTHVAGIIGAIDNAIDTAGVAESATLVAIRVLGNSGNGLLSTILEGLDYVAQEALPGDCVNLSLATSFSTTLNDAVVNLTNLGLYVTVAAGNNSTDANTISPASANADGLYTVSAIDDTDTFASFSNYGNPPIDFAAPGVDILSSNMGGGVRLESGTSMAAPHVCGLLLVNGGILNLDGTAINDPDGTPDPIPAFDIP